ncbi:MAG: hypothetical protein HQK97_01875 [Nitrospirae bacterium]|nr:hypothetical protein [Nitrospirota bacterium]
MGKDSGKGFDFEKYSYLTQDTPLLDWIDEFLKRNESFQKDSKKAGKMNSRDYEAEMLRKYRCSLADEMVWELNDDNSPKDTQPMRNIIFPQVVAALRILEKDDIDEANKLNENRLKYIAEVAGAQKLYSESVANKSLDEFIKEAQAKQNWTAYVNGFEYGEQASEELTKMLGYPDKDNCYPLNNMLLLAVNMNHTYEKILESIKIILQIHKPKKVSRLDTKNWKDYLIVYDLYNAGKSISKIAEILSAACPDPDNKFSEPKTIENYLKSATLLIDGGYRKYI